VVQAGILVISTPVAEIFGLLGVLVFLWLLTNFVAVLHGFSSLFQVFLMILVSAFGIAFGLSIILTLIGVTMPMMDGA
jgi:hypothetical protein